MIDILILIGLVICILALLGIDQIKRDAPDDDPPHPHDKE